MINENDFNKFRKINKGSSNFLDKYQDPTYLGFKLFFWNIGNNLDTEPQSDLTTTTLTTPEAPAKFSAAMEKYKKALEKVNKLRGKPNLRDFSTVKDGMSTRIWQERKNNLEIPSEYKTFNSEGLFGMPTNPNSALFYLNKIGDFARYEMLVHFIKLLSELNSNYDHYFQGITGLDEAWKRDYTKPKFKKEIVIDCLESLDLRITGLMDLYRKVVFDWENRRYVLPDNLRTFSVTVKVFDYRNFSAVPGGSADTIDSVFDNEKFFGQDKFMTGTQLNFDLHWCEFLPDDSGTFLESVSNNPTEPVSQKIKFSYEKIEENSIYRILNTLAKDDKYFYIKDYLNAELDVFGFTSSVDNSVKKDLPGSEKRWKKFAQDKLQRVQDIATDRIRGSVEDTIRTQTNTLFLGNVYGFSPSSVTNNPEGGFRRILNNTTKSKGNESSQNKSGNVYE